MSIFVLVMDSDVEKNNNFYFLFDENIINIDYIDKELEKHKKSCEQDNIRYNYILAIRKLESIGLQQVNTYIKEL